MSDELLRTTYKGLAFGVAVLLVGGLAYWMLSPGEGPEEFQRAQEALRRARSWRITFVGREGEPVQFAAQVSCPRVHLVWRKTEASPGDPDAYKEFLVIDAAQYLYRGSPGAAYQSREGAWELQYLCEQVQNGGGNPRYMPSIPALLAGRSRIEKGELKTLGGAECRVWRVKSLLMAEDYKNEDICIGTRDHLPYERVTQYGRFTYSDWNAPVEIPMQ